MNELSHWKRKQELGHLRNLYIHSVSLSSANDKLSRRVNGRLKWLVMWGFSLNDIAERLARMAMATGHLDPGHYHLVVSGQIPFPAYLRYPKVRIVQTESESKYVNFSVGGPMDIKITKTIYKREDTIEITNQIFSIIEKTFRPGWCANFTISLESCRGNFHTDPPEDSGK